MDKSFFTENMQFRMGEHERKVEHILLLASSMRGPKAVLSLRDLRDIWLDATDVVEMIEISKQRFAMKRRDAAELFRRIKYEPGSFCTSFETSGSICGPYYPNSDTNPVQEAVEFLEANSPDSYVSIEWKWWYETCGLHIDVSGFYYSMPGPHLEIVEDGPITFYLREHWRSLDNGMARRLAHELDRDIYQ